MTDVAAPMAYNELKRKAAPGLAHRWKKACIDPGLVASSMFSEDEGSGFEDDDENDDQASRHGSGTSTPLTTHSTKQIPQWPSRQKTIPCTFPDCTKMFNRQAKLQDHLRSHNNERQHVCPEPGCGKDFLRKTHLERHVKSAHSDERDFLCSYEGCGKGFSTGTRLRRHEAQHAVREEYKCSDCGKEFRKQATLQRHIDAEHKGELPYACEYELENGSTCGARFLKAGGLQAHHRRLHDEKSYWCELCLAKVDQLEPYGTAGNQEPGSKDDFGFATYSQYQVHMRDAHPPMCDVCSMTCQTKKLLSRHKELEHGILPASDAKKTILPCPDPGCSKVFSKKGNMDVHFRSVHANQRPFVCGQVEVSTLNHVDGWDGRGACGKDFKAKVQLEDHIRTTHLGLLNRAQTRKAAKAKELLDDDSSSSSATQSRNNGVASYLAGTAYSENLRRNVDCPITGCRFRFTKQYDCDVHVQLVHGIDGDDLDFHPISSYDTTDLQSLANQTIDSVTREAADNSGPDFAHELELNARQGGAFWIGAHSPERLSGVTRDNDCDHFAATQDELNRLVGDVNGWEDDIIMDPALREV